MKARFPGKDARTGGPIAVGDEITRYGRGWTVANRWPADYVAAESRMAALDPITVAEGYADRAAVDRTWNRLDNTIGRNAANDYLDNDPERARADQEYAAGIEDANRERFNRTTFGESYAAAEEYARDMRGLNGDW